MRKAEEEAENEFFQTTRGSKIRIDTAAKGQFRVAVESGPSQLAIALAIETLTMALHERTVSGEWSARVIAPRPAAGEYTVHAWMTTMGDAPLFAAAAPVTVR